MAQKLLIDAAHGEETRVAAIDNGKLAGFEIESRAKKQISGNIYLAKVVRIESALQAVFVEYGGNRHGFLAFPEIHPDYYVLPMSERGQSAAEGEATAENPAAEAQPGADPDTTDDAESPEAEPAAAQKPRRKFRVQEVIRKDRVLLVQVTKDERGGKGAALTTYISLAGRYCVLMPNSDRNGGISRKITNVTDRRKLKKIATDIEVPDDVSLIIRTAGADRTKQEIRRDFEFLLRQWNTIRELALNSNAPAKIYEEGNLIRRTIRDDYSKGMDEIIVQGESGYRMAKDFMKLIMPSHAKKVKQYSGTAPIFSQYNVERDVNRLFDPVVQLKSGGYIVIDITEALVSIDVNSGRSTRAGTLEKMALDTNLEAAEAVADHLRLRNLAGLIVIDFIDMEESRSNQKVVKRLKECVKSDRAKIQIGGITGFGLLEMSRQRLKPGIREITTRACSQCNGTGRVREDESLAIDLLRRIEIEAAKEKNLIIQALLPVRTANYLVNERRADIVNLEARYNVTVNVLGSENLLGHESEIRRTTKVISASGAEQETVIGIETPFQAGSPARPSGERKAERGKRRRKRGGRGGAQESADAAPDSVTNPPSAGESEQEHQTGEESTAAKGRRRPRRRTQSAEAKQSPQQDTGDMESEVSPEQSPDEKPRTRAPRRRRKPAVQQESVKSTVDSPDSPEPEEKQPAAATESAEGRDAPPPAEKRTGWWSTDFQQ
ncbi:MAG: Rne/Rng family ribonuclease [Rhodobacteraceae bacterium]|nr:Rne/Rng family ribonuclease [Paracoccaceae bacterium]